MDKVLTQTNGLLGVRPYSLIEEATEQLSDEFSHAYMQGITSPQQVREYLQSRWNLVLEGVASELAALSLTLSRIQVAKEKATAELEQYHAGLQPPLLLRIGKILDRISMATIALLIVGGGLISSTYLQWSILPWSAESWWHAAVVVLSGLILILGSYFWLRQRRKRLETKYRQLSQAEAARQRIEIERRHDLNSLSLQLKTGRERARLAVVEKLMFEGRAFYQDKSEASYSVVLPHLVTNGLAAGADVAYEINTVAKDKLDRLLKIMPSGSIGLAGPRGAGKTTLLRSLYDRSQSNLLDQQESLAIYTTAPVHYEAREFILHLFSSVCQQVLAFKQNPEERQPGDLAPDSFGREDSLRTSTAEVARRFVPILGALGSIAVGLGMLMLMFALILATESVNRDAQRSQSDSATTMSADTQKSVRVAPVSTVTAPATQDSAPSEKTTSIAKELGLTAATLFSNGFRFFTLGTILFLLSSPLFRHPMWSRFFDPQWEGRRRQSSERSSSASEDAVAIRAQKWLHELRFQQSFSVGWSGSLKLPIGIEGSVNQATSLAQKQYSLPEIVKEYGELIGMLPSQTAIIIAVDELDKMDSYETAQRFMNEIKVLFGLPRCFYIVSVSEDALSSFERRGMPLRDAFDSAFDMMIYVGYLSRDEAFRLVRRRVIGMPVPFLAFCHAASGGLPRDLIRICREMFESATDSTRDMRSLCEKIILHDLASKTRATISRIVNRHSREEANWYLKQLRKLQDTISAEGDLLSISELLMKDSPSLSNSESNHRSEHDTDSHLTGNSVNSEEKKVQPDVFDLGVYTYYAATLREITSRYGADGAWNLAQRDEALHLFDELARVRQDMVTSVQGALERVSQVRRRAELPIIMLP